MSDFMEGKIIRRVHEVISNITYLCPAWCDVPECPSVADVHLDRCQHTLCDRHKTTVSLDGFMICPICVRTPVPA